LRSSAELRRVRSEAVTRAYLLRQRQMREEMLRRLGEQYRLVRAEDISATFEERFTPVAARTITAAQGQAQTLTRAYLRGIGGVLVASPFLAGTSAKGMIAAALIGIVPVILAAIRDGSKPEDALTLGAAYVDRTADNEYTRVIDSETDWQAERGQYAGWIGHSYNSRDACVGNDGFHTFDVKMYRHPSCRCDRELVPLGQEPKPMSAQEAIGGVGPGHPSVRKMTLAEALAAPS